MNKSDRLRQLEIAVAKLEMHVQMLDGLITLMLHPNEDQNEGLESGKWYQRNPE
jgi:hypothetical protein